MITVASHIGRVKRVLYSTRHDVHVRSGVRLSPDWWEPLGDTVIEKKRGIQSIEVGWRLIDALSEADGPLALSALASRAGMPPSKARTYLVSFIRTGLLRQDPETGLYDLGERAVHLGLAALTRVDVIESSRVAMQECRDVIKGTTFLSLLGNMGPTIVYWLQGPFPVTVQVQAGSVLPLIDSATGQVFLTFAEPTTLNVLLEREQAALPRGKKTQSKKRISAIKKDVNRNGLASIEGGLIAGVSGISAPIFDHEERLRAVITTIGRIGAFDASPGGRNAQELKRITTSVSRRLGSKYAT